MTLLHFIIISQNFPYNLPFFNNILTLFPFRSFRTLYFQDFIPYLTSFHYVDMCQNRGNTVYNFISNVKTTYMRIRCKQRLIPTLRENNRFWHIVILRVDCLNDNQALIMQETINLFQIHKTLNKILLKQIRYFLKQIRYPIVLSVWTKSM